jgi:hypothetical protein
MDTSPVTGDAGECHLYGHGLGSDQKVHSVYIGDLGVTARLLPWLSAALGVSCRWKQTLGFIYMRDMREGYP